MSKKSPPPPDNSKPINKGSTRNTRPSKNDPPDNRKNPPDKGTNQR